MSCPVCFNASAADETVRASLNLGILVLMGVTAVVLAGFLRFIISIARLSKADVNSTADLKLRRDDERDRSVDVEAGLPSSALALQRVHRSLGVGGQARLPV